MEPFINFECSICSKSFKTQKSLNKHTTTEKHKINAGLLYFEPCKYCKKCITSSKVQSNHYNTPAHLKNVEKFNKINSISINPFIEESNIVVDELVSNMMDNIYAGYSDQTDDDEITFTLPTTKPIKQQNGNGNTHDSQHCKTCNCVNLQIKQKIEIDEQHQPNNKALPPMPKYNPSFITNSNNTLYIHQNGKKYNIDKKIPMIKYYEPVIDKSKAFALIPEKYEIVSLSKYSELQGKENKDNYFRMPTISSFEFSNKFMYDTKNNYDYSYDVLYYDIEAASTNGKFAKYTNPEAFITMIQICHVIDKKQNYKVFTLNKYKNTYDIRIIKQQHPDVIISHYATEQNICCAFIRYLIDLEKTTLIIGFNASGTGVKITNEECENSNKHFQALKTKEQLGYDLPFIIGRSGMKLTEK